MSQSTFQPVRGTHDYFGLDYKKYEYIVQTCTHISSLYSYEGIATPIFESTSVFKRTLGDTSDVVNKEMYTFTDKGGEEITLRPEGTASVVRALISQGMAHLLPLKFFYHGPMFRYERPQKGRYRQFHQFGAEYFGNDDAWADVEAIAMAHQILKALPIAEPKLNINTLGDQETRHNYREALVTYLNRYKTDLSSDSQVRLEKNPLRILDSKNEKDQEIVSSAPILTDYLTPEAKTFFDTLCLGLNNLGIPFTYNPKIVRGLDYYTHTVFEFITDTLGAQGTVLAGGRYDGLVAQLGGPKVSAIGWATGIERLMLMLESFQEAKKPILVLTSSHVIEGWQLVQRLRYEGIQAECLYQGTLSKQLKKANKMDVEVCLILGEDELKAHEVTLKNLTTKEQIRLPISQIIDHLKKGA